MTPVLLLTGPVGVGKTAVLNEASRLLHDAGVPHAAVVLAAISRLSPAPANDEWNEDIAYRNLAAVWSNYAAAGARRLLLERVLEQRSQLHRLTDAIPDARVAVVRLRAPLAEIERRIRHREPHEATRWHIDAARYLVPRMDRWAVEDHLVINSGGRSLEEVARDVLQAAGWLPL